MKPMQTAENVVRTETDCDGESTVRDRMNEQEEMNVKSRRN